MISARPLRRLVRPAFFALALWLVAVTRAGSDPRPRVDADALHTHVEYLASDALQGRAAGTRGHELAAQYVSRQFELVGLEPAGDDGGWFQQVPLLEADVAVDASSARLQRGATAIGLEAIGDFLPRATFVEPDVTLSAPVVFAGFGVSAPGLDYDDFAGIDVHGRIVVILSGAPAQFPHNQRAYYSSTVYKYAALARHGAAGVIVIDSPAEEQRRPWSRTVQQSWMKAMRWTDGAGAPHEAFPQLRARFLFSPRGAARLFEGSPVPLERVFERAQAGRPQAFALPVTLTLTSRTALKKISSVNVVGMLRGSDPALRSQYIVYTAHLDHVGMGAPIEGDAIYNGAVDNASGVAILIETARALASLPTRPRRSLVFLAVTAEERGLLGSDYFARHPTVPALGIVANINMDMPVAFTSLQDFVAYGSEHSTLGAVAKRAARRERMRLSPDPLPEEVSFVRSDQYSFVRQGIPALDLSPGLRPRLKYLDAGEMLADFLAHRYHMPGDDASQPIHYPTLAALGRVMVRIGLDVANAAQRPRWHEADFFGQEFGAAREEAIAAQEAGAAHAAQLQSNP